jgi:hypothetical protein
MRCTDGAQAVRTGCAWGAHGVRMGCTCLGRPEGGLLVVVCLVELPLMVLQYLEVLGVVVRQPGHIHHPVRQRAHRGVGKAIVVVIAPALCRGAHR